MLLSIVIRNLNEGNHLKQALLSIQKQQVDFEYEIIVVDNESDDDSVKIASDFGCKIITLKRSEFTFGHSLNYGIQKVSGSFILILSAHIILLNEFFLKNIPAYFHDPQVAGLRFVNAADKTSAEQSIENGPQELIYSATVTQEHWQHLIINHCAAIRKSCWNDIKFNKELFAGEDKQWAIDVLKAGNKLLYNVPCYYIYTRTLTREQKIKRQAIETASKELLTSNKDKNFEGALLPVMFRKIQHEIRRSYQQLVVHKAVYNSLIDLRKRKNQNK